MGEKDLSPTDIPHQQFSDHTVLSSIVIFAHHINVSHKFELDFDPKTLERLYGLFPALGNWLSITSNSRLRFHILYQESQTRRNSKFLHCILPLQTKYEFFCSSETWRALQWLLLTLWTGAARDSMGKKIPLVSSSNAIMVIASLPLTLRCMHLQWFPNFQKVWNH